LSVTVKEYSPAETYDKPYLACLREVTEFPEVVTDLFDA
jgi:hypothetical protein